MEVVKPHNMAIVKKQVKSKFYSLIREINDKDKCPPQALVVVKAIAEGKSGRKELVEKLSQPGRLTTTQTPERIFSFYRPRLIDMGVVKEEVVTSEIDVEVPDKPEKPPKEPKPPKEKKVAADQSNQGTEPPKSVKGQKGEKK